GSTRPSGGLRCPESDGAAGSWQQAARSAADADGCSERGNERLPAARCQLHESMIRRFKDTSPDIAGDAYIDPSAQIIGDVVIGAESSVWMNVVVRGDVNRIRIGRRTNLQD